MLAAGGLITGLLGLGVLTSPDPEASQQSTSTTTSTTTTTLVLDAPVDLEDFTLDQIETGQQLTWELVETIEGTQPQSIVDHDGTVYLFTASPGDRALQPASPRVWRTHDGVTWEPLGAVIGEGVAIASVASTSTGLLAVEANGLSGDIRLLGSVNGDSWSAFSDPIPTDDDGITIFQPLAVAANDRVVVVAGLRQPDAMRLAEGYLLDSLDRLDLSELRVGWNVAGQHVELVMRGPLDIPAIRIPASDLGLSDDELEEVTNLLAGQGNRVTVWSKAINGTWTSADLEGASWLTAMRTTPEGRLVGFGYGVGASTWWSDDGETWERMATEGGSPYFAETWGDRLVGMGDTVSTSDVLISTDGIAWQTAGLGDLVPTGVLWHPLGISAGIGGIAALSEVVRLHPPPEDPDDAPQLERDGYVLTLDETSGELILRSRAKTQRWSLWTSQDGLDGVALDLRERTVDFHDPDTGEPLISFSFDELKDLERQIFSAPEDSSLAFSFSSDGEIWSMQSLESEFGDDAAVFDLTVTEDRVIALVLRRPKGVSFESISKFEIWSAEIPTGGAFGSGTSR